MKRERGFTLLEVLVATLIMAVAVTSLLAALSTSMRNAARLTEHDRAALLARQKMNELLVTPHLPENTALQGAWDESGALGWIAQVTPYDKPDNAGPGTPILERIALQVWWISGGQRRTFTLEGFRRGVFAPPVGP